MKRIVTPLFALAAAALINAGCSTPAETGAYPPQNATKFDLERQACVVFMDPGAQQSVTCTGLQVKPLADGRFEVNANMRNRENRRIQVFNDNGEFKTMYLNVGAPWAVCVTPGAHQYLYSSNSNGTADMDNGEIYKMELDGKILGKFGHAGKLNKEFGSVHEIDCRNPNEIYVGEITNWRVQKLILHPEQAK